MPRSKLFTPKDIGEYPHKPHYEVRNASEGYSNIAAVLSGFAFAAILLVIQIPNLPEKIENSKNWAPIFRDWATISFLVAFIGCLLSAFTFAIVKGEEILTPRSHAIALLGACGFIISANLVLWGIATIVKVFLSPDVYRFIFYTFPIIMTLSMMYANFSAFDPIISFENREITLIDYAQEFAPAHLFSTAIIIIKWMGISFPTAAMATWFNWIMTGALVLILVSATVAIITSMKDYSYKIPLIMSGVWIGLHAFVIGLLILMI
jgi:hypothetical protein